MIPVPVLPGFHPDPSVVRTDEGYFLVTSTLEYLPGLTIHHSVDLEHWQLIGHVATRPGQLALDNVITLGGAWAPTIRYRDGVYYVIVTDAFSRGTLLFSADHPAGPWSDGTTIDINGIDPDLAWDDDGSCYLTFSGLQVRGGDVGRHFGIQQVRVDLETGRTLEPPRSIWSGTGLMSPEAPHLYKMDQWWYLFIAQGGSTGRGHSISIARSASPAGPFEGCPNNPLLTTCGTDWPIQATAHGDLIQAPDGRWVMMLLGSWSRGLSAAFTPLGRETFATEVVWENGWPRVEPVDAIARSPLPAFRDDFDGDRTGTDWIAVRRFPADVARVENGELVIEGEGRTMDHKAPTFVGRRQTRLDARIAAQVRALSAGTIGGISLRYDEQHHYDLELQGNRVIARAVLPTIRQEHEATIADGPAELAFELRAPARGSPSTHTCDLIDMVVTSSGNRQVVATLDGRYLSMETTCSFTGRVAGIYCRSGRLHVDRFEESDL